MMIGNNDRQTIREKAPPPAPANAQPPQPEQAGRATPAQARQAAYGPWEFQSEKWEHACIKRIDATIAALKSGAAGLGAAAGRATASPLDAGRADRPR